MQNQRLCCQACEQYVKMQSQDKWDCIKQLSAVAQVIYCVCNKHLFKPSGYNHLHGLIFELKERMNSRQDQPVIPRTSQKINWWDHIRNVCV